MSTRSRVARHARRPGPGARAQLCHSCSSIPRAGAAGKAERRSLARASSATTTELVGAHIGAEKRMRSIQLLSGRSGDGVGAHGGSLLKQRARGRVRGRAALKGKGERDRRTGQPDLSRQRGRDGRRPPVRRPPRPNRPSADVWCATRQYRSSERATSRCASWNDPQGTRRLSASSSTTWTRSSTACSRTPTRSSWDPTRSQASTSGSCRRRRGSLRG